MYIFNSLGSNYWPKTILAATKQALRIYQKPPRRAVFDYLRDLSNSKWILTYKGRHALSLALKAGGIKSGDKVGLQAFTCWAVEEAIVGIGAVPVYIDTDKNRLNLGVKGLENLSTTGTKIKALIVQHTLGYPAQIEKISEWCRLNKVFLIEDLAHSWGAVSNNKLVGTFGDAAVASFGRDKIIDGVSGGAYCTRLNKIKSVRLRFEKISFKELWYPFLTLVIRKLYPIKIGKLIHLVLRKTKTLTTPVAVKNSSPSKLPNEFLPLIKISFAQHLEDIIHRREIATIYNSGLNKDLQLSSLNLKNSTCLRYPILVKNRNDLTAKLKKHNVYLADTWYRQPVDTSTLQVHSKYIPGSCKNAEYLAEHVYNLPTHRLISKIKAKQLVKLINKYA